MLKVLGRRQAGVTHTLAEARRAELTTLNPRADECAAARAALEAWPNVDVLECRSWDFLADYDGPDLDLVFGINMSRSERMFCFLLATFTLASVITN